MRALLIIVALGACPVPAPAQDRAELRREDVEFEQIAQLLALADSQVVADVGAGGGSWTFRLAQRVGPRGRVYATEVKTVQIEGLRESVRAKRLANVEVIAGSQQDTGLPPNCCDALLLRLVYHAFDRPESMRASLHRAMKTRGLVLVIDFRPSAEQLAEEMSDGGFERVQVIDRWQGMDGVYAALFRKRAP